MAQRDLSIPDIFMYVRCPGKEFDVILLLIYKVFFMYNLCKKILTEGNEII